MLYLDNAATTYKKPKIVLETMIKNTIFCSVNAGRGGHKLSIKGMEGIINTQDEIAKLFNIKNPQNIAFTQNATYALNMAILGTLNDNDNVIVTQMEHNSVLRPVNRLCNVTIVKADKTGYVNPKDIEKAIVKSTKMIICTHASNVCGTIENVEEVGKIANKHKILFMIDTAQTAGCLDIDNEKIHADFIAFSGHKGLMGPLGTGGLFVKNPEKLNPVIVGGTGSNSESIIQPHFMPDMLHSGTMNVPAIVALGKGAAFVQKQGVNTIYEKEKYMADKAAEDLKNISGVTVYGNKNRVGTVSFNINNLDAGTVSELLEKNYGIIVRSGYHCAPLAHEALGTDKTGSVRASFGFFNKNNDEKLLVKAVSQISKK